MAACEAAPALAHGSPQDREAQLLTDAEAVLRDGCRAVLSYSGGLESNLLLDMLAPWRDRITVVWVNARALPHMPEYVRRRATGWHFVELAADPYRFFRRHGLPTRVLPLGHTLEAHGDKPEPIPFPPLRTEGECCVATRMTPLNGYAFSVSADVVIHGQRGGEGTWHFAPNLLPWDKWGPLMDWPREDVAEAVQRRGIELPEQYAHGLTSFECAMCPVETGAKRLGYLKARYPEIHAEAVELMRPIHEAITRETEGYRALFGNPTDPAALSKDRDSK